MFKIKMLLFVVENKTILSTVIFPPDIIVKKFSTYILSNIALRILCFNESKYYFI